jgi:hypothetical protein
MVEVMKKKLNVIAGLPSGGKPPKHPGKATAELAKERKLAEEKLKREVARLKEGATGRTHALLSISQPVQRQGVALAEHSAAILARHPSHHRERFAADSALVHQSVSFRKPSKKGFTLFAPVFEEATEQRPNLRLQDGNDIEAKETDELNLLAVGDSTAFCVQPRDKDLDYAEDMQEYLGEPWYAPQGLAR